MKIRVVEVRGDQVRLGIEAPRDLPVHRLEVWKQIQQEKAGNLGAEENPAAGV